MPSNIAAVMGMAAPAHGPRKRIVLAAAALMLAICGGNAQAQRPPAAVLLDRLCSDSLRPNEEDRLFGMISLTVRATLKYQGGVFSPDLIDDAMQDSVGNLIKACPKIAATPDPQRLGVAVEMIQDATTKRMQDRSAEYSERETEAATAADLSEELSAPEIDAWLEALPARRRTLALFLYASGLKPQDMAEATGLPATALAAEFRDVKGDLLKFFRSEASSAPPPPIPGPAMEYRVAGPSLAGLLAPPQPGAPASPMVAPAVEKTPAPNAPKLRITGIAPDIFAGWSLLATATGLPPDRTLEIGEPLLLEPDAPGRRRMIVTAAEEISDPHDQTRRFLLKAYAVDAENEGAGLQDSFHLAAPAIDNPGARDTLRNASLAAIEVARCLWHDYGTAEDPGLCR